MTTTVVQSSARPLKLAKGKVYLVPSIYASAASDSDKMGELMPAIFHSFVGAEENLQLFVEVSPLFIGLPLYHLVPMAEVRRMPPTFKNVVGTPLTRAAWEARSSDLMQHMDMVVEYTRRNNVCEHRRRLKQ